MCQVHLLSPKLDHASAGDIPRIVEATAGLRAACAGSNEIGREGVVELSTKHLLSVGWLRHY